MDSTDKFTIPLYQVVFSTIGIGVSFITLILMIRANSNSGRCKLNWNLHSSQILCDVLICALYITSKINYGVLHYCTLNRFLCKVFFNEALFWFFVSFRSQLNVLVCLQNFIKLLYPFESKSKNMNIIIYVGLLFAFFICGAYITPYILFNDLIITQGGYICETDYGNYNIVNKISYFEYGAKFMYAMYQFAYLYLFPFVACSLLYHQLMGTLNNAEENDFKTAAYYEIMKGFLLDSILFAVFYGPFCFYSIERYVSIEYEQQEESLKTFDTEKLENFKFILMLYSLVYNLLSLLTRRRYQNAALQHLKHFKWFVTILNTITDIQNFLQIKNKIRNLSNIKSFRSSLKNSSEIDETMQTHHSW